MAGVTKAPLARLRAICLGALDVSALSAHAQAKAIPANDFHAAANNASLRSAKWQANAQAAWERSLSIRAPEGEDFEPRNTLDGFRLETLRAELLVGFLDGMSAAHLAQPIGSETRTEAAEDAEDRAQAEASRLVDVLSIQEFYQAAPAPDPFIVSVTRLGTTTIERPRDGLLMSVTRLELVLWVSNAATGRP